MHDRAVMVYQAKTQTRGAR